MYMYLKVHVGIGAALEGFKLILSITRLSSLKKKFFAQVQQVTRNSVLSQETRCYFDQVGVFENQVGVTCRNYRYKLLRAGRGFRTVRLP